MCATVSNAYFRVCQNAAHWEEQVLLLRTQNEILAKRVKFQEFVEKSVLILRDVFKQLLDYFADQQVHDQAYLKTTSEILRKLELVAKSEPRWKSLFRHFDNLTQTIGAELGTGPYALLFEDVHCAMARVMDLVIEQFAPEESKNDEADEHAEHVRHVRRTAFELYPVDHDQMMKYMFKIQTLETSLLEFSKDHQAHLDAALWFAKLAENCSLTSCDIQTRHAKKLLVEAGFAPGSSEHDLVFKFQPPQRPKVKYPVLYGVPRQILKTAFFDTVDKFKPPLEPWPQLIPLLPLSSYVPDMIETFGVELPQLLDLDRTCAKTVSRVAGLRYDESGCALYQISSHSLLRALCLVELFKNQRKK